MICIYNAPLNTGTERYQSTPEHHTNVVVGIDWTHHYHQMPKELVKILDSSHAKVMFQSVNSMEMLYKTTGFRQIRSDYIIGRYGHVCYHWVSLNEIAMGFSAKRPVRLRRNRNWQKRRCGLVPKIRPLTLHRSVAEVSRRSA